MYFSCYWKKMPIIIWKLIRKCYAQICFSLDVSLGAGLSVLRAPLSLVDPVMLV